MTCLFAPSLAVGQRVNFSFRQTDSGYALVSITAQ
ncbi:copper-binding protein [Klebsiella huaxiensis]|uniref:Copper-binding protein n=1 Tax=Klebsiella huaxiensis TaxID=2153354 RepID=A0ABT6ECP2_9ENTR|nr:copper-binding protein [Klebsiella huaxiensis]MDG1643184.1 copper-binding protein [Klebsiella huaxiensis]